MDILNYIKPKDNDKLNDLKGMDLQDFLILLDEYYLELRNSLGIDKLITFGFELEFENLKVSKNDLNMELVKIFGDDRFYTKNDSTLHEGGEIATPVFRDEENNWKDIKIVCETVRDYAEIGRHAGGHVHVGTQALGGNKESWLNFAKLWATYENIIYRFSYGKFMNGRSTIDRFAMPVSNEFYHKYKYLKNKPEFSACDVIIKLTDERRKAVNLKNVNTFSLDDENIRNTIEFRCPNGTLDEVIWQNNLNVFVKILEYAKSDKFNHDIVARRRDINSAMHVYDNLELYEEMYLDQALEFCDLIFDNNLDKIYFLKQYIKSFNNEKDKIYDFTKIKKNLI